MSIKSVKYFERTSEENVLKVLENTEHISEEGRYLIYYRPKWDLQRYVVWLTVEAKANTAMTKNLYIKIFSRITMVD